MDNPGTDADAVLDGLDPEQREVATALRGPVCVLAGAGTGKTRAITHRIAYGVRAGPRSSRSVLAVTFTARAAGEMRGRLRELGVARRAGPHLPRRRAAPAAVLLAAGDRRAPCPGSSPSKIQLVAEAAAAGRARASTAPSCATSPPRSSGPRSRHTVPRTTPPRAARAGREPPPGRPGRDRHGLRAPTRTLKRDRGRDRLRGRAAAHRRPCSQTGRDVADAGPRASTATSSSTSTRTSSRCSSGCSSCGSATATTCAWSVTPARRSTPSPAPRPDHLLDFRAPYPRRHRRPAGPRLPLHPAGRRAGQQVCSAARPAAAAAADASSGRSARPARSRRSPSTPTSRPRPPPSPAHRRAVAGGHARVGEIAVLFRVNAQSEVYEQALADAGVPYVLRGAERFFDRAEVREARAAAARRGPRRAGRRDTLADAVRAVLTG